MKKVFAILLILTFFMGISYAVAAGYTGDSESCAEDGCNGIYINGFCSVVDTHYAEPQIGTNGYQIANAGHLYWYQKHVTTKQNKALNAELIADIVVNENMLDSNGKLINDPSALRPWKPIGSGALSSNTNTKFSKTFNGNNHSISGLYYNDEKGAGVGLFGSAANATINGVHVKDSYFCGHMMVGGIAGEATKNSNIQNCSFQGFVKANYNTAGGIVGSLGGMIERCSAEGIVEVGSHGAGGIAGGMAITGSKITTCYNAASISCTGECISPEGELIGGIAGGMTNSCRIEKCHNVGKITGTVASAITGSKTDNAVLRECYYLEGTAAGAVNGKDTGTNIGLIKKCTARAMESGEICYQLNGKQSSGDLVWFQTLGTDAYPKFEGGTVIQAGSGYRNKPVYNITIADTQNGTVGASVEKSEQGKTVTLTITPAEGYELDTLEAKDVNGNEITVTDGKFTMPDSNITVTATFKEHEHKWNYAVSTSETKTIIATCGNTISTCPVSSVTIRLLRPMPEPLVYDGTPKTVTVEQTPADTFSDLPDVSYCCTGGCINAGEHTATLTYGGVTAEKKFTISQKDITGATIGTFAEMTYNGAAQTPSAAVTIDGFTVTGTWSSVTNVSDKTAFTASGNFKGTIADQTTGMKRATPKDTDFTMTPPANLYYTGETKTATVAAADGVTGMGTIMVSHSPENPVGEGTYDVLIDVAEGDNYAAISGLNVGSFTIRQSGSAFSDVKTYLGSTEEDEFTYGQLITVKGNVQATGEAPAQAFSLLRAFTAPAAKQVALFDATGTKRLSEPAAVSASGAFVLTYDTTEKLVDPAESVTLMVKFVGDENMADASTTVSFKLNTKTLTPVSAEAEGREYAPGNTAVSVTAVTLDGIVKNDNVSVNGLPVNGTLSSDAADTYVSVILPQLTLTGADAAFYSVSGTEAATNVTISPKAVAAPIIVLAQTNFVYDGTEKKPAVTTVKDGENVIPASEYTVSYSNNVNAGTTATVSITDVEGGNYTVSGSTTFTITQTQTAMTAQTDKVEYTYGDVITVTGTADVPQPEQQGFSLLRAFAGPSAQQVALYDAGGNQLTDGVDVVNGAYTIPYDTTLKGIVPGQGITLTVKFVGDANMSDQFAATNSFTLNAKSVAPALGGAVTKAYDGTADVPAGHGLSIRLDGLQGTDSVSVTGSFAYADASVGTGKTVTASGLTLGGTDAKFYALSADTVSSACGEIAKAQAIPMSGTTHVINNHAQTYEIDLSQYLPALEDGRTFGSVSYALDGVELGSYYDGGAAISGSVLSLPISAVNSDEEKTIGAVTVTVSSQNYADSTLTLAVSTTNHQHQWNFTGSGDTITAACSNEDGACTVPQVIIRLVAPTDADLAYTGTTKTVTIEQAPDGMFDDLPDVRYCHADGCIGVGEHTAALNYRGATAEKKFTIGPVDAASAGGDAEIVDGTMLIVTKDTELPDSAAYYGEAAKTVLEKKFGAENTVAKIEVHMQEAGEEALAAMSNVNTGTAKVKVLEISLKYWDEPSGKWLKITEETLGLVPKSGVEVVIPYDLFGFTDVDNLPAYRFIVQHMITLPMDDAYQIGDIEDLSGEAVATAEGLKIHVEHGFSPFVVGYAKVVDQAAIGALPQTGDHTQLGAWLAMLALCGAGMLTLRSRKRRTE